MADNPALFYIQKDEEREQPFQVFIFDTSSEEYILRAYSETYVERADAANMVDIVQGGSLSMKRWMARISSRTGT